MEPCNTRKAPRKNRTQEATNRSRAQSTGQALLAVALFLPLLAEAKITRIHRQYGPVEEIVIIDDSSPTPAPEPSASPVPQLDTYPGLVPEPEEQPSPEPVGFESRWRQYEQLRSLHRVGGFQ